MITFQEVYKQYSAMLDKEDLLINNRMNWLLGSQSLLLAGIANGMEPNIGLPIIIFLQAVAMVGAVVSLIIWLSVIAAIISFCKYMSKLRKLGKPISDSENYPQLYRSDSIMAFGFIAPFLLPPVFIFAWMYVFSAISQLTVP